MEIGQTWADPQKQIWSVTSELSESDKFSEKGDVDVEKPTPKTLGLMFKKKCVRLIAACETLSIQRCLGSFFHENDLKRYAERPVRTCLTSFQLLMRQLDLLPITCRFKLPEHTNVKFQSLRTDRLAMYSAV